MCRCGGAVILVTTAGRWFLAVSRNWTQPREDTHEKAVPDYFAHTSLYCRDYQPVNGLMVPYVLQTKVQGVKQSHKMTIESLVMNPKLDNSLVAVPKIQ